MATQPSCKGSSPPQGLTTLTALQRLREILSSILATSNRCTWVWGIFRPPQICVCISICVTVLLGAVLVVAGSISHVHTEMVIEGGILLTLGLVNALLHVREIYVKKNFLLLKLKAIVESISQARFPEDIEKVQGLIYPVNELLSARGFFTTPTLRDGRLVHVPNHLLVEGDVIQLGPDRPAPADIVPATQDSSGPTSQHTIHIGDKIGVGVVEESGESVAYVSPVVNCFTVIQAPIVNSVQGILQKKEMTSSLESEISATMKPWTYCIIWVVLLVAFLFNLVKYLALPADFSSWSEMLFAQTGYAVLPIVFAQYPIFRAFVNAYGASCVMHLMQQGKDEDMLGVVRVFWRQLNVLKLTFLCLISNVRYANWQLFHVFGSATVFCCVDKEYVLSPQYPIPDKVFFLHSQQTTESQGEKQPNEIITHTDAHDNKDLSSIFKQSDTDHTGTQKSMQSSPQLLDSVDNTSSYDTVPSSVNTTSGTDCLVPNSRSSAEEHMKSSTRSLHVKFKDEESSDDPIASVGKGVEVNVEVLGLSCRPEEPREIFFNDINWMDFIDSLKAIGLSSILSSHVVQELNLTTSATMSASLLQELRATDCMCSLGVEVGVTDYATTAFQPDIKNTLSICPLMYESALPAHSSSRVSQLWSCARKEVGSVPYMLSTLLCEKDGSRCQMVSRSHADFAVACCRDFWDGSDLLPLGMEEKRRIKEFYTRHSLLAHTVLLSYRPALEVDCSQLSHYTSIFVPFNKLVADESTPEDSLQSTLLNRNEHNQAILADTVFQLQNEQIFLGLISLQYHPYEDIVALVEDLSKAGIRFVHFSAESELRENIFSERMGLETGWNCHISLAEDDKPVPKGAEIGHLSDPDELAIVSRSSSDSSLSNILHGNTSYVRAQLPKGIARIRPHLQNVDNVPLLVPLFTDCQPHAIQEMINIMQENGEVVVAIGNAWNPTNVLSFAQANLSLGLIPGGGNLDCMAELYSTQSNYGECDDHSGGPEVTAMNLAIQLNTLTCQSTTPRHAKLSIITLITESRHILSASRHALVFSLGFSILLSLLMLISTVLFLPPPLSGSHLFHLLLLTLPVLSAWLASIPIDKSIKSAMPDKNKTARPIKWRFFVYFLITFVPTSCISVILFAFTLASFCRVLVFGHNSSNASTADVLADCHPILGNRNESSNWNGWQGVYAPELVLAQSLNSVFLCLSAYILALFFIHRAIPLWRLYRFASPLWLVAVALLPVLLVVHAALAYVIAVTNRVSNPDQPSSSSLQSSLSGELVSVWVFGVVWLCLLVPLVELLRLHDRKQLAKSQRFLRLEFETKLGMNSPF